ncbi:hypothetical protein Tco_1290868 [Tanacetum coccineum]
MDFHSPLTEENDTRVDYLLFSPKNNLYDTLLTGYSEWPTCSWKDDGYCNRGNLPGAYLIANTLRYQDLEWYEALKDDKLKEEALKNTAIMDGMIDKDDESSNEGWKR